MYKTNTVDGLGVCRWPRLIPSISLLINIITCCIISIEPYIVIREEHDACICVKSSQHSLHLSSRLVGLQWSGACHPHLGTLMTVAPTITDDPEGVSENRARPTHVAL